MPILVCLAYLLLVSAARSARLDANAGLDLYKIGFGIGDITGPAAEINMVRVVERFGQRFKAN